MAQDAHESKVDSMLRQAGIDPQLSRWVLDKVRRMDEAGGSGNTLEVAGFPRPRSGPLSIPESGRDSIADISDPDALSIEVPAEILRRRIEGLELPEPILARLRSTGCLPGSGGDPRRLDRGMLRLLGLAALPRVSYGILNGGSATSYVDEKKNRGFHGPLFEGYLELFTQQAGSCTGRAKGLTPGYINPDGSSGFSFIELKIRSALLLLGEHDRLFPESRDLSLRDPANWPRPLFPLFQMTSSGNDAEISAALEEYRESPALADLVRSANIGDEWFLTGIQPMIAALTHSGEVAPPNRPRDFFLNARGRVDSPLALPGGHGQNFFALEGVYRDLRSRGKRLAYLGNVDNLGFLADPVEIALMILFDSPAGFDFSYKTRVDVKGGVLLETSDASLTCGDIGPAISRSEVEAAEGRGDAILFNCATGLFDLNYLDEQLLRIQQNLPLRVSDQDKDAGRYAQAEQVTWEVMGLIDGFTAFGVDKYRRFLASKLIVENFMTSGIGLEETWFPTELGETARALYRGFIRIMEDEYRMEMRNGRWLPSDAKASGQA
jgi:UTP--glucose-1-phosphate uridylyltransferase